MNESEFEDIAVRIYDEKSSDSDVNVCTYDQGGLGDSLAHLLANGIELSVTVVEARDGGHPLVTQATADPDRVHSERDSGSSSVRQAIALSAGGVAVWSAPVGQAD